MKRLLLCLSILAITVGLYATDEARVTGTLTIEDGEGVGIYVVGYHQSGSSTNNPGRPLLVFVGNSAVIIHFDTIREMQCDGRTPESDNWIADNGLQCSLKIKLDFFIENLAY